MPATKAAPTHTEDSEAFSPITDDLHPHGENPDAPAPESVEALADELARVADKLYDTHLVLRRISGRFEMPEHEEEHGVVMAAAGLADRAHTRLQEAADALRDGHTDGVAHWVDSLILTTGNAHALITDWYGGYPSDVAKEVSGTVWAAAWTFDYVGERLDFLVHESDLPFD